MCNEYESKNRERIKMKKEIEKWQREMEERRKQRSIKTIHQKRFLFCENAFK